MTVWRGSARVCAVSLLLSLAACGGNVQGPICEGEECEPVGRDGQDLEGDGDGQGPGGGDGDGQGPVGDGDGDGKPTDPGDTPVGNPDGTCSVPEAGGLVDVSNPTTVVGTGSPESCNSAAFVAAVAKGGIITFNCGGNEHTINLDETAKVFNDASPEVVIDGGGLISLSGQNQRRILYQNTCDPAQHHTTPHCDNQDHPRLTVQNITFVDGNATNDPFHEGGAMYVRGGQLKIVNARFFHNQGGKEGQDLGGGAVRALQMFNGGPIYVTGSTFGGPDPLLGNWSSNGGALASIHMSWTIVNSHFENNRAVGDGGNPAKPNTVGGGSGGAIYNDGNLINLTVCGTKIINNHGKEYGGGIFFVSNDKTGHMVLDTCTLSGNVSEDAAGDNMPGIFYKERDTPETPNTKFE